MPNYNNPWVPQYPNQSQTAIPQTWSTQPSYTNMVNPYTGGSYQYQQAVQPQMSQRIYDWVLGESGAAGYPVARGDQALLLDATPNSNKFWIKSTDPYSGRPLPLESYRYEKEQNFQNGSQNASQAPSSYDMEYVPKNEMESMKREIAELKKMLEDLTK